MTTIPLSEIPTISLLYHLKKLQPADVREGVAQTSSSQPLNDRIGLIRGDITKLEVDAIVNAANSSLRGGGGVDGAIHRAAGPELLKECRELNGCETGSAKITNAYRLPCKKVIHAVGPVYDESEDDQSAQNLAGCYMTSLKLAAEYGCRSIAFSAISTGVYGYPSMRAARVAIRAVKTFLEAEEANKLEKVIFCTFVPNDVDAYNHWLPVFFPPIRQEDDSDWEEIERGESADNGPVPNNANVMLRGEVSKVELPDVPETEPSDGPAQKKHKSID